MIDPLLVAEHVRLTYAARGRALGRRASAAPVVAVDDVSLTVDAGEAVGVVGESGSGKSSFARVVAGVIAPDAGTVALDGEPLGLRRTREQRRAIQMVFQDPAAALNPRMTVADVLRQLLTTHGMGSEAERERRVRELIDLVGLPAGVADVRPGRLSGGQRQRASIARALAVRPRLLIADEPTSALDVSVQATILELLDDLRRELSLGVLFISHNLAVVRSACSRVVVMRRGVVVEQGPSEQVLLRPEHEYTRLLLSCVPEIAIPPRSPA